MCKKFLIICWGSFHLKANFCLLCLQCSSTRQNSLKNHWANSSSSQYADRIVTCMQAVLQCMDCFCSRMTGIRFNSIVFFVLVHWFGNQKWRISVSFKEKDILREILNVKGFLTFVVFFLHSFYSLTSDFYDLFLKKDWKIGLFHPVLYI